MAYGMQDMIRKVTNEFNMTHIESQIRDAMLKGERSITFKRNDVHTPNVSLPTGWIHMMQAMKLAHDGYKVEHNNGLITVAGWMKLEPYVIPE